MRQLGTLALVTVLCAGLADRPVEGAPLISVQQAIRAAAQDTGGAALTATGEAGGAPPALGWHPAGGDVLAAGEGKFRLDRSGLLITPPSSPHSFQYSFESAVAGGEPLETLESVPPFVDAAGAAVYARGGLEEKYLDQGGVVEQLFVIPALPAAGDLVVRGRITSTTPFDPARSDDQHLNFGLFLVTKALALDGGGRTVTCPLTYAAGAMEIRVPGAWLAGATLPVTIDPLLGTEISLDMPPAWATVNFRGMDVCYNATNREYFVVWSFVQAGTDFNLWGRRVNAETGATVAARIDIDISTAANSMEPAVAWNSTNNTYLVAYTDSPIVTTTNPNQSQIVARVLTPTGTDVGGKFTVTTFALTANQVERGLDVAYNRDMNEFLVVWARTGNTYSGGYNVQGNIHARRVPASGPPATPVINVDTGTNHSIMPCVAYLSSPTIRTYLVAYSDKTGVAAVGTLRGRTVIISSTGVVTIGALNTYSTEAGRDHDWPKVAANSRDDEFLVVWDSDTAPGPGQPADAIMGRRVGLTGTPLGPGQIIFQPNGAPAAELPDVDYCFATNEYFVVYDDTTWSGAASQARVHLARIRGGTDLILENNLVIAISPNLDNLLGRIAARSDLSGQALVSFGRANVGFATPPWSWWAQRYESPTPVIVPPRPPGPGSLKENANGDNSINDACGATVGGGIAAGLGALALAAFLALTRRR